MTTKNFSPKEYRQKRKWAKPKLIVLIRGKSDESVLHGCKQMQSWNGPVGTHCGTFDASWNLITCNLPGS